MMSHILSHILTELLHFYRTAYEKQTRMLLQQAVERKKDEKNIIEHPSKLQEQNRELRRLANTIAESVKDKDELIEQQRKMNHILAERLKDLDPELASIYKVQ
eukprot:Colp12_sorted_trinity150504_noHs@24031